MLEGCEFKRRPWFFLELISFRDGAGSLLEGCEIKRRSVLFSDFVRFRRGVFLRRRRRRSVCWVARAVGEILHWGLPVRGTPAATAAGHDGASLNKSVRKPMPLSSRL